jgi:hypothetical protein
VNAPDISLDVPEEAEAFLTLLSTSDFGFWIVPTSVMPKGVEPRFEFS